MLSKFLRRVALMGSWSRKRSAASILAGVAFLGLSVVPLAGPAQTIPIVSDWLCTTTGSTLFVGRVHLIRTQGALKGSAASPTGQLITFSGHLSGNRFTGTFSGPGETGWITFTFSSATEFSGEWGLTAHTSPGGAFLGKYQHEQVVPVG